MTKTIETQLEKSRGLIQGLRKHLNEGGRGTTEQEIADMEKTIEAVISASNECERVHAELASKMKNRDELFAGLKAAYADRKLLIRNSYPRERWMEYGVPDKQ